MNHKLDYIYKILHDKKTPLEYVKIWEATSKKFKLENDEVGYLLQDLKLDGRFYQTPSGSWTLKDRVVNSGNSEDLNELDVAELIVMCQENGIDFLPDQKKQYYIDLLSQDDDEEEEDEGEE